MATPYILLLTSVALTAVAQILFKSAIRAMPREADLMSFLGTVIVSPMVLVGILLFGLGFLIWLVALRDLPVSRAYAFVAFGIVLVTLFGSVFLKEGLTLSGGVGVALVVAGLAVMALSSA